MITEQDISDLKGSWGNYWKQHTAGKEVVEKKAAALLAKMKGKGWAIYIGENLGWYYHLSNLEGHITVSPSEHNDKITYFCLMSLSFAGAGDGFWTDDKHYDDPNEAAQAQIKIARNFINEQSTFVKHAEAIYKEAK